MTLSGEMSKESYNLSSITSILLKRKRDFGFEYFKINYINNIHKYYGKPKSVLLRVVSRNRKLKKTLENLK